jgi:hypothetical protein
MEGRIMKKTSILLILIIVTLLAVTTPVAALSVHVDLGKTFKSHLMNISYIDVIDIWNISQSQSQILTTVGDGSDIQTLHNPTFNTLTRHFTPSTGTHGSVNITVNGDNPSTVDWTTLPAYSFYIQPIVPTIQQKIPGMTGNPLLSHNNDSWTGSASDEGLFLASKGIDMYKTGGILDINTSTNTYTNLGSFSGTDYNISDWGYTLRQNELAVDNFSSSAAQSLLLGNGHPETKANTGSYFLSTIRHDEPAETTNVYSVYHVIALKAPTPLTWQNTSGSYTANQYTYFKGSNQNVILSFIGTNPDTPTITNITYLIMNRTAAYDINMDVDTDMLAANAESQWQNSLPSGQVIDFLFKTIAMDVNIPFTYTITAADVSTPSPSTLYSRIAITPGYGISGNTTATSVTVPGAALDSLKTGYYDIYLMGTNSNNDVVALDQKQVLVTTQKTNIGVVRNSNTWILDTSGNGAFGPGDVIYTSGKAGDAYVTGNWTGIGITKIGVVRNNKTWILDSNGDGAFNPGDYMYTFGKAGDVYITGDWNGNGITKIGVVRNNNTWILDMSGDGAFGPGDIMYTFGKAGDVFVTGKWNIITPPVL